MTLQDWRKAAAHRDLEMCIVRYAPDGPLTHSSSTSAESIQEIWL